MKYGQNNLLDIRGTIAAPFILFHPATWEVMHETEFKTTQKLGKMFFSHSRYDRTIDTFKTDGKQQKKCDAGIQAVGKRWETFEPLHYARKQFRESS